MSDFLRACNCIERTVICLLGNVVCAVFRGGAIAWFVFSKTAYRLYITALLADYLFCITSTMILRRIKDIPRRELVWDIAGICAGKSRNTQLPLVLRMISRAHHEELI